MALHPGKLWALGLDNSLTILEPDIARPPHELWKKESKAGRSSVVACSTSMRENLRSCSVLAEEKGEGFASSLVLHSSIAFIYGAQAAGYMWRSEDNSRE